MAAGHIVRDPWPGGPAGQRELMPPRVLPWLYFACAWVSLALAFAAIAIDPHGSAGFFYHPRLAGIVHLVTLGWITLSILGALYVVGPLALRLRLPAGRGDALAFASVLIGVIGVVGHFWIEEFGGMAWSGMMVALGVLFVVGRIVRRLRRAPIPGAVKLHVVLAFANIAGASAMGVLLAFDKSYHFLPGFVVSNAVAHAHLAGIGWASMMVVGIGYRLLPMVLPAEMPRGITLYASAFLLEAGAAGLFVTLLLRSPAAVVFAVATAAGFLVFAAHGIRMLAHRRRPPPGLPVLNYAVRHAGLALASLGVAIALGVMLAVREPSELTMKAALAYGVLGLVGFLAQMVVAMQVRLLPLLGWYSAAHRAVTPAAIPAMSVLSAHPLAGAAWLLWLWGVPALAAGFAFDAIPLLVAAAVAMEVAVLIGGAHALRVAGRRRDHSGSRCLPPHDGRLVSPAYCDHPLRTGAGVQRIRTPRVWCRRRWIV